MSQDFSSVLAGFVDAARGTEIKDSGFFTPPPGEYHLQIVSKVSEAKSNQYGPFVQTKLTLRILDPGEFQGREFPMVYLINTDKNGQLNFGGQHYVTLAGILNGEPIEDNNPLTADAIVAASAGEAVLKARLFKRKTGYLGMEPLSLETPAVSNA